VLLTEPASLPKVLGVRGVDVWVHEGRDVVVIRREDTAGSKQARSFAQRRHGLHPVERLGAGDEIGELVRQPGLVGEGLDVAHVSLVRVRLRHGEHRGVGLDPDNVVRSLGPGPRGKAGAAPEVHDPAWAHSGGIAHKRVEEDVGRSRSISVVVLGEAGSQVAALSDRFEGELAHRAGSGCLHRINV